MYCEIYYTHISETEVCTYDVNSPLCSTNFRAPKATADFALPQRQIQSILGARESSLVSYYTVSIAEHFEARNNRLISKFDF